MKIDNAYTTIDSNNGIWGLPSDSDGKESTCNTGDLGLIPGLRDPLEEGIATHSSILPGESPWTEETGELQSMVSQRVGHD